MFILGQANCVYIDNCRAAQFAVHLHVLQFLMYSLKREMQFCMYRLTYIAVSLCHAYADLTMVCWLDRKPPCLLPIVHVSVVPQVSDAYTICVITGLNLHTHIESRFEGF